MRDILIYDVIGEDFAGQGVSETSIAEQLKDAAGDDVLVRINSPGGFASVGVTIHSLLTDYSGRVNVKIDGLAASAASIIALAGDEVEMASGSRIMIHDPWALTIGNAEEHTKSAAVLDQLGQEMAIMYAARGSKTAEEFRELMREEAWFVADEAIEVGLATHKTEVKAKACFVSQQFGYRHTPQEYKTPPSSASCNKSQLSWAKELASQKLRLTRNVA